MSIKVSLIGLLFLTLINCQGMHEKVAKITSDSDTLKNTNLIENSSKQIVDLPPILDNVKNQIPKIDLSMRFNLQKESDDKLDELFLKLDSSQVDYFYSTEELRQYYDYFNFHSYYFGYNQTSTSLIKVFIINTNWETAIYLDCFILNEKGEIVDIFRPSYIEMQPSYSFFGFGSFQNDATYKLTMIDYETLDFINYKATKDSSTAIHTINKMGKISTSVEKHGVDTVYSAR